MVPQLLIVLGLAFGLGAALLYLAGLKPALKSTVAGLWPIYISEFIIVLALLIPAAAGDLVFAAVLLAFIWRGQFELQRLFDLPPWGRAHIIAMAAAPALIAAGYWASWPAMVLALGIGIAVLLLDAMLPVAARTRIRSAVPALSLVFPALLAACVLALRMHENGLAWIVIVYGTVEVNDAAALVAGKLFGRTRILPRLSPGKTEAGLFGGLFVGYGTGLLLAYYLLGLSFAASWPIIAVVLVAGVAGDLFTSALKRFKGKKDFPSVLTAHGGVLDIYDAVLIAAPVLFLLRFTLTTEP